MIGFKKKENLYLFAGILILGSFIDQLCFSQVLEPKWTTSKFDFMHLSVVSPFAPLGPSPSERSWNAEIFAKKNITICWARDKKRDFSIVLIKNEPPPKYKNTQLKDIPSIMFDGYFSHMEWRNYKTTSKPVIISGVPALLTKGTFETKDHTPMKMESLDFKLTVKVLSIDDFSGFKKEEIWVDVYIYYESGNPENEKMADKIIDSLQILN